MKVVHKYHLAELGNEVTIALPLNSNILFVDIQDNLPCMWVEVHPTAQLKERIFKSVGTGVEISDKWNYIGSCQHHTLYKYRTLYNKIVVYHIYEK